MIDQREKDVVALQRALVVRGTITSSHVERLRVPRWPRISWLRWISKEVEVTVIDGFVIDQASVARN